VLMRSSPQREQDYLYNGDIWFGILCWTKKGTLHCFRGSRLDANVNLRRVLRKVL
jgi:hypothetical protein